MHIINLKMFAKIIVPVIVNGWTVFDNTKWIVVLSILTFKLHNT